MGPLNKLHKKPKQIVGTVMDKAPRPRSPAARAAGTRIGTGRKPAAAVDGSGAIVRKPLATGVATRGVANPGVAAPKAPRGPTNTAGPVAPKQRGVGRSVV